MCLRRSELPGSALWLRWSTPAQRPLRAGASSLPLIVLTCLQRVSSRESIATAPRGDGGFGYDPVFVPDEAAPLTFAEMSADAKNRISHRGRALRALAARLGV